MSRENRNPAPMSALQKTALILLGLILTVVILEAGLRLGGFVLSSIQEHRNRVSISQRGTYRILCLGDETTTAGAYHHFLEETLNERNKGIKFSVIDQGYPQIKTDAIVDQLNFYLDAYSPDMVITMMGIYDSGKHTHHEIISEAKVINFLKSCRTYKLARLLWRHLMMKLSVLGGSKPVSQRVDKEATAEERLSEHDKMIELGNTYQRQYQFSQAEEAYRKAIELDPQNYRAYVFQGTAHREQGKFPEAEGFYRQAITLNPRSNEAYVELGTTYRKQGKFSEAEAAYKKAIELDPRAGDAYLQLTFSYQKENRLSEAEATLKRAVELNPNNEEAYSVLGDFYFELGKNQDDPAKYLEAERAYRKASEVNPEDYNGYDGLVGFFRAQGKYAEAMELFKKFTERFPEDPRGYDALAMIYGEINDSEPAKEYSDKAQELRLKLYDPSTASNYQKLREILRRRGVTYVCMQYPMRDVGSLKKIFEGDADGITFVDNERIFKDAIRKERYAAYFGDMFAGDFGHCTPRGNRLLAENIADTILREVFKQ